MDNKKIEMFYSNRFKKIGFFKTFFDIFKTVSIAYPLGIRLFKRDFKAKYRQQIFGVLWVILEPTLFVLTFVLLANASVFRIDNIFIPYPVYAFLGAALWGIGQKIIIDTSNSINLSKEFILQINFPREALVFSPILLSIIDFVIKMLIFFILCLLYTHSIKLANFFFLLTIFPLFLFSIGLGMIFSILGAVIKDIAIILILGLQFLFLITPIMYPLPVNSMIGKLAKYNPLYYLLTVPRDLLLYGKTSQLNKYILFSIISIIVFLLGWRFFKISILRIVEKT